MKVKFFEFFCANRIANIFFFFANEMEEVTIQTSVKKGREYQFTGKKVHLTYPTHISHEEILAHIRTITRVPIIWWSCCWERGSVGFGTETVEGSSSGDICTPCQRGQVGLDRALRNEAVPTIRTLNQTGPPNKRRKGTNGESTLTLGDVLDQLPVVNSGSDVDNRPYDHTHFACEFASRIYLTLSRVFDIKGQHPNIKSINSPLHAIRVWQYHKKQGQYWQGGAGPGEGSNCEIIGRCSTLSEAVEALSIPIKSVQDVALLLRDAKAKRPQCVNRFPNAKWTVQLPEEWCFLFLHGPSNTGKTCFAKSLFSCPLFISTVDDLRMFDPAIYDGIIFDDVNLANLPRETVIAITDFDDDRTIHCRYTNALIPAGTRKVLTSNKEFDQVFPFDEHGAIKRRVTRIAIRGRCFDIERGNDDGGGDGGLSVGIRSGSVLDNDNEEEPCPDLETVGRVDNEVCAVDETLFNGNLEDLDFDLGVFDLL